MAVGVANQVQFAGFIIFLTAAAYLIYRFKHVEEGLGEFSKGLDYRDFYGLLMVMVPLIAAAAYFFISLGLGTMTAGGREVVWLRYFEWSLTTPLLVLGAIMLAQQVTLASSMMVLDFLMVLTGFIATVTAGTVKHMSFIASSFFFVILIYLMVQKATQVAEDRPGPTRRLFKRFRNLIIGVWVLYPIVWILSTDGYAFVSFEVSSVLFLILDVTAKIGFAYFVLRSFGDLDMIDVDEDIWEE